MMFWPNSILMQCLALRLSMDGRSGTCQSYLGKALECFL